jgi:hypothetical protein
MDNVHKGILLNKIWINESIFRQRWCILTQNVDRFRSPIFETIFVNLERTSG